MKAEEAPRLLVDPAQVKGTSQNDGVEVVEARDSAHGLRLNGQALFKQVVGDGMGDFFR
jgi:hypothetical protein